MLLVRIKILVWDINISILLRGLRVRVRVLNIGSGGVRFGLVLWIMLG